MIDISSFSRWAGPQNESLVPTGLSTLNHHHQLLFPFLRHSSDRRSEIDPDLTRSALHASPESLEKPIMSNELNDDQPVNEMDLLANMECSIVSALIPEVVSTAEEPAVLEQEINDEDKNVPPSTAMEAAISAMFATPEHEEEEEMMMVVGTEPVNDDINNVLISGEDDEKIGISSSSLTPTHLTTTTTMEAETIEGVTAEEEDAAMRDMTPGLVAHPSLPPRPDLISDFPSTTARPVASDFISAAVHSGNPSSSSAIAAVPVGGGGMSKFDQLTARLAKDPRDGEARLALLADVEAKGDLERTREVYEEFLTVFPDAVSLPIVPVDSDWIISASI